MISQAAGKQLVAENLEGKNHSMGGRRTVKYACKYDRGKLLRDDVLSHQIGSMKI